VSGGADLLGAPVVFVLIMGAMVAGATFAGV
jgi:hypothetical protein